ncbi:MAG TPA: hypothetical protein VNL92_00315 [Dehalococcoidia bacterium]|nr:hypothetical protein [Dehalococcoidia bacterium]
MASSSKTTTDHEVIRAWVEQRKGHPATVTGTGSSEDAGMLRIDFDEPREDERDERLEPISWEQFFEKFEEKKLAFLYQDKLSSGKESRFFKFVSREGADEGGSRGGRRTSTSGSRRR